MSTIKNLNEIIQNISVYNGAGMKTEVKIPVDIPTKPYVFNSRYVIDLSYHLPKGFKFHYISILPFVRPNMTMRVAIVDRVIIKGWPSNIESKYTTKVHIMAVVDLILLGHPNLSKNLINSKTCKGIANSYLPKNTQSYRD